MLSRYIFFDVQFLFKSFFSLPVAPSTVIYDFACSLHAYCLNRDPIFFKDTRFLVDRFHWGNHTGKKIYTD